MPFIVGRDGVRRHIVGVVVVIAQLQSQQVVVQEELISLNRSALALINQRDYAIVQAADFHPDVDGQILIRADIQVGLVWGFQVVVVPLKDNAPDTSPAMLTGVSRRLWQDCRTVEDRCGLDPAG